MYKTLKTSRDIGSDLLRCLSMLMVIMMHMLGHGGMLEAAAGSSFGRILMQGIQIAVYPAVDCFVLLSGYFLCRKQFSLDRIAKLWLTAWFWSVLLDTLSFILQPENFGWGRLTFMFFPVLTGKYWFLNAYIFMMLLTPALNSLLNSWSRGRCRKLLVAGTAVCSVAPILAFGSDVFGTQGGYGIVWFVYLYLLGGSIRIFLPKPEKRNKFLLGYFGIVMTHLLYWLAASSITAKIWGAPRYGRIFLSYTSPMVLGSAVCLLQYFRGMKLSADGNTAKICRLIEPGVFGVYLIHDHPWVRQQLAAIMAGYISNIHPVGLVLFLLVGSLVIFAACVLLDLGRGKLYQKFSVDRYSQRICRIIREKVDILVERE